MKKMGKSSSFLVLFFVLLAYGFVHGSAADVKAEAYELIKGNVSMKVTNFGARIMSLILPDKNGKQGDIVLGFDTVEEYLNEKSTFGSVVGRVSSRISGAQFTLNGTVYKLPANNGNNTLHGGPKGFDNVMWTVEKHQKDGLNPHIVLAYHSVDGDQGFPGDLLVTVTYALVAENQLGVVMEAKALNKPTPVIIGQHNFWNLGGHDSGDILSEEVQIFASKYIPVDSQVLPTGQILPVKGTPFDFLKPTIIQKNLNNLSGGYDMNFVLDGQGGKQMKLAAIVSDNKSGRRVEIFSDQLTMHFYTSNKLNKTGKGGFVYKNYAGLNLQTEGYPNAVNQPSFPSTIVNPGQTYKNTMLFKFSTP